MKKIESSSTSAETQKLIANAIKESKGKNKNNHEIEKNLALLSDQELFWVESKINDERFWSENVDKINDYEEVLYNYWTENGMDYDESLDPKPIHWYRYFIEERGMSYDTLIQKAKEVVDDYSYNFITHGIICEILDEVLVDE